MTGDAVERVQVEREDLAVGRADEQALEDRVDRQGGRPRHGSGEDGRAGLEIVRAELRAGDDVDAVAGAPVGKGRVVAPGFDEGIPHRHAEIARGADAVVSPGNDAAGHRVLGQVGVGPFVDVV